MPSQSIKQRIASFLGILERLEQQGVDKLDVRKARSARRSVDPWYERPAEPVPNPDAEALLSLGVLRVCNIGLGEGEVIMTEPPTVGATSADVVVQLATRMARLPDNLAKLQVADATERHLFVWVDSPHHVVAALDDERLPEDPPDLPDEIDAVWLAIAREPSHVWRWSRSTGWEDLGWWQPREE